MRQLQISTILPTDFKTQKFSNRSNCLDLFMLSVYVKYWRKLQIRINKAAKELQVSGILEYTGSNKTEEMLNAYQSEWHCKKWT